MRHNTITHYDTYGFPQTSPIAEYKPTTSFESSYVSQSSPQSTVPVDSYGSPRAPVLNTNNIGHPSSYPNALHEITMTDDVTHNNIIAVNSDDSHTNILQYDSYGFSQANVISDLPDFILGASGPTAKVNSHKNTKLDNTPEFLLVLDNPKFLNKEVTDMTINSIASNGKAPSENSEADQSNVPQKPSVDFPDQEHPEKYFNNDQEKLDKELNTFTLYCVY